MKSAVVYARVSSKEQEREGFSIPAQQKLLREYAAQNGIKIVREFIDVETAKVAGRSNFNKMVEFIEVDPSLSIILVEKTDRLYRNFRDYVLLEELNLEIHLVKEGEIISQESKSHAKFIHGIKLLMAKNYIDNLSEEVKKGMREKAEQGEWPGQAPLGYINNTVTHLVEVDPKVAPFIVRMFELYSTGEYSLSKLKGQITSEGLRSRNGFKIAKGMVESILKNPFYYGDFVWKKKRYKGKHESIITRELFDRVQSILRRGGKPKSRKDSFAFTGLLKCARCGCQITAEIKKGKYVYYHCTNGKGKCDQPYIREEVLDEKLSEIVRGIQITPEIADWIVEALKGSYQEEKEYRTRELSKLNKEYNKIQNRLDKAYEDKIDGIIDDAYWFDTSTRWREDQDAILTQIEKLKNANRDYLDKGVKILELAQSAYSQYLTKEPKEKRRLLNSLLSNCTIDGLTLCPTYKKPFNFIHEGLLLNQKLPRQDSNLRPAD